ncbi:PEP-CTERM sorting domain-containing protein [Coraliomargarita algicola]|uniref:PEP-CTERM sorting domain-containing protein n=1 Tax=Coraliomargarita algicola TaxID=3092156 RepID=A0ABZ0RH91_9BACT|nr:PEP-CTERM sorting domain-containing protein [Coraliomargarita sp. J2-16]WPJ95549.1 PEP-CTERM sorting domain-containing protein [Coraliomargarita sp. J2-16]
MKRLPNDLSKLLLMVAALPVHAATVTWTGTTDGNWSEGTNWDSGAPSLINDDDILFQALTSGDVVSTVDSSWSVNSVTFEADNSAHSYTLDTGATTLSVGAGGITTNRPNTSNGHVTISGSLEATANQTWHVESSSWNRGRLMISSDISGSGDIEITGAKGGAVFFQSGVSTGYTGAFTLSGGGIRLLGISQLSRLGSNALTWNTTDLGALSIGNLFGADQALSFATPIHFAETGTQNRSIQIESNTTGDSSIAFTGNWTGNLNQNLTILSTGIVTRFLQDGSTLTSTKGNANQTNSALFLSTGEFSVENANAFGAGNSLSISLGVQNGTSASRTQTSLWLADGLSMASDLFANRNWSNNVDTARSDLIKIGTNAENADVTFTGNIRLETTTYNAVEADFNKNREANVHLVAGSGSTATFSGDILEYNTSSGDHRYVPVIVEGGGSVIISGDNNTYRGGTSVINGTTLYANGGSGASGSSTGQGGLKVGYDAAAITGDMTSGQSIITGVDTSHLHVGQSISGTGIVEGTVITYIHPTIAGRIEISNNITTDGTGVSITAAAETGVLGGSGVIKPDVVNGVDQSISVASGSSIAPGNSIGTLTLNGADTSAALLTMDAGAAFNFEVDGSGGASDQLQFWNYVSGDLVLNNNDLNITLSGTELAGEYTVALFEFYSDSGSTIAGSDLTSGLVLNLGEGLGGGTLNFNGGTGSIELTYTVVPEPSMFALVSAVLGATVILRRRG